MLSSSHLKKHSPPLVFIFGFWREIPFIRPSMDSEVFSGLSNRYACCMYLPLFFREFLGYAFSQSCNTRLGAESLVIAFHGAVLNPQVCLASPSPTVRLAATAISSAHEDPVIHVCARAYHKMHPQHLMDGFPDGVMKQLIGLHPAVALQEPCSEQLLLIPQLCSTIHILYEISKKGGPF